MPCFKEPPAQFGKILARTPFPQTLLFFPQSPWSAERPVLWPGSVSLASILSRFLGLAGEGLKRRRMSRGWGRKRAPALLPEDPRCAAAVDAAPAAGLLKLTRPRARSLAPAPGAQHRACPYPRPGRPTPKALLSLRILPMPRILTLSVTRVLDTQRPVHPAPGHPLFSLPYARKPSHPGGPRLGHPTYGSPGVLETLHSVHLAFGAP